MRGTSLTLGLVGVLAVAGVAQAQGSRAIGDSTLDPALVRQFDAIAADHADRDVGGAGNAGFAREHGLVYLGAGTTRSVFSIPVPGLSAGRIALKIGRVADNRAEARVWREAPVWMRDLLVPVLGVAADGKWLAMEQVKPITPKAYAVLRDNLAAHRSRRRLLDCGVMDLGLANTASDGRILDYAYLGDERKWRSCAEDMDTSRAVARDVDPKLLRWVKRG